MAEPVVLISGKIGSHKSTVADLLSKALGCRSYGFGDYVRKVAQSRQTTDSRANLQAIGEELINAGIEQFCTEVLSNAGWTPGASVILHGLRHRQVRDSLSALVAPQPVHHLHLSVPEEDRRAPLNENDRSASVETHSTEVQVATTLRSSANLVIEHTDSRKATDQVLQWLADHRLQE